MRKLSLCTFVVATACAVCAQSTQPVAYPHMGTDGSRGQLVPLGYSNASGNFDEGRWQQVVPARFLPGTGGAIFGLDVLSQDTNTTTYPSLTITMSLVPPGTTLSSTFAANLPTPIVVFTRTNHSIGWTRQTWTTITLDTPFVYDGVSDLVVDIQKTFDRVATPPPPRPGHHQTSGDPGRTDLPSTRYAYGVFGSGAATAPTARSSSSAVLKMRFQFAGPPTLTLTAMRGGSNSHVFAIGGTFDASVHGIPGNLYGGLISIGWLPLPGSVATIGGVLYIDPVLAVAYGTGMIGASGVETRTFRIPNNQALVGGNLTFQAVSQDANANLLLTNASDCLVND